MPFILLYNQKISINPLINKTTYHKTCNCNFILYFTKINCMRFLIITVFLLSGVTNWAQNNVQKEKFHFQLGEQDTLGGYAQIVKVGNVLYVSGTVAVAITETDVKRVYTVIEKSLNHFGASLQNVVKETIFTTDIESMKSLNHVRKKIYKGDYPSSTWVQVSRLFMPEAKLEIEVVAHLPEKQ